MGTGFGRALAVAEGVKRESAAQILTSEALVVLVGKHIPRSKANARQNGNWLPHPKPDDENNGSTQNSINQPFEPTADMFVF